ncbi:hypothetical protein [Salisaeta longa]|uniref:hypothetical protein n=1 Tax=Salisaeta longa TaxID=503170 RepID=UPI00058F9A87|nr:hypothetical protein [Salisaeta longa]
MPYAAQYARTFNPKYSLLGRIVRWWVGDRLRSEALFIVLLTLLGLLLLMAHYLGWALLQPTLVTNPDAQMTFWIAQVASVTGLLLLGVVGWKPRLHLEDTGAALHLAQGRNECTIAYDDVTSCRLVSARTAHMHHRSYQPTTMFTAGRARIDTVLVIRAADAGPVVVALPTRSEVEALRDLVRSHEPVAVTA